MCWEKDRSLMTKLECRRKKQLLGACKALLKIAEGLDWIDTGGIKVQAKAAIAAAEGE